MEGVRFPTRYLTAALLPGVTSTELGARAPSPSASTVDKRNTNVRVRSAVDKHLGLIWRVARRAGLGREDAEDAAQLAFLVLSQRLADVPPSAELSFLISTVLRVAKDLRVRKWHTSVDGGFDADTRESTHPSPEEQLDRHRAFLLLTEALDALDECDRLAFVLVDIEQMSRREAAELLHIPEGTVASRLAKARTRVESAFCRTFKAPRRSGW